LKNRIAWIVFSSLLSFSLASCQNISPDSEVTPWVPFATSTKPSVAVQVTHAPTPELAARAYLEGWQKKDYAAMYAELSSLSRDSRSLDKFKAYYEDFSDQATLQTLEFQILNVIENADHAEVRFEITLHTILVGDINRSMMMQMSNESDGWKVAWDYAMVLPELKDGNTLLMQRTSPARGIVYDRNGKALAYEAQAVSIGIVPGEIDNDRENAMLSRLEGILGRPSQVIRAMYANAKADWYVPLGIISVEEMSPEAYAALSQLPGVHTQKAITRYYYGGGIAAHVVGYVGQLSKDQLFDFRKLGYAGDEAVGQAGLEQWGEQYLAGKPQASLDIYSSSGSRLATLAESTSEPAMNVYTTLDRDLQSNIEKYLFGPFSGAVVVLQRDTGAVLAMMSSPTFDSNAFVSANQNSQSELNVILNNAGKPLLNRATLGQYPLGSVFKIITMSAALESGTFKPESQYECDGYFREIPGLVLTDWTVEWDTRPHGRVSLKQALEQSCDTYFYHIGLALKKKDPWLVPNMARSFGLGKPTGIGVIDEEQGFVPDPAWKQSNSGEDWTDGDAVQMAIGQGTLLVTPLQVADFVAAVGNGGTLYRPQLIQSVQPIDGPPVYTFTPEVRAKLPVKPENLSIVQEAMRMVVVNVKGTAYKRFLGLQGIRVAGKTGTATTNSFPDCWFAAYTFGSTSDKPDIAVVVIDPFVPNGEGSIYAAPMVRRVMELYYYGHPFSYYAWESTYGVRGTDTPIITDTQEGAPETTPVNP
jgi:penicillin-binding protein 2